MNTIKMLLARCNIVSPFELRSSDCKKTTNDEREIVANKFKEASDSIWREKISAGDKVVKAIVALPVGGLIEGYNNMNPQEKLVFITVAFTAGLGLTLSFVGLKKFMQTSDLEGGYYGGLGIAVTTVWGYILFTSPHLVTAMKNRRSTIRSTFNHLKALNHSQVRLSEGLRDFKSLLVSNPNLNHDVIGNIGQNILDASVQKI